MFIKSKGTHISEHRGHKEMSLKNPYVEFLNPSYVYIPLVEQNTPCDVNVKVGDLVKLGQIIANKTGTFCLPIHASVSGEVISINEKMWHASGKMVATVKIKNDFTESKCEAIKPQAFQDFTQEQIVEAVFNNGVVGLGGSGFPTYFKLKVKQAMAMVIINAAECEPYITTDYALIKDHLDQLIRGMKYLMKAVSAPKGFIAIKENKKTLIQKIKLALTEEPEIAVFELKDEYPAGWEKYIVQRITGKNYHSLPSEVGVVVNNASTAVAVCQAVEENHPLIEKMVTITGEGIKEPTNVFVKIGTKVSDIIEQIGGYADNLKEVYFIAGGPMTGKSIYSDQMVVNRSLSSVVVMPKMIREDNPECMGCGKCSEVCPVWLSPIQIKQALDAKNVDSIKELKADLCMQCGLCSYICPSRIELTEAVAKAKAEVLKKR
ncbi:MAG TPA: electron transport complex subunit RsxC [Bacilli bacterium]|nr:MAG: Electron transport complex protein RnfC [Tenericutes bacterium ADurb.BinA124]HNZ50635.1 electron transport complex subunit RsxC [Bacilli bacterium]HPX84669.1 electron transport complex subunit RsxC [Bacilli bacterium]HQC74519.1 electron transport complex subunit RsxC [Bacilli bacterium]